ncbi:AAA family ATPase [Lentisalinibacter orientalis]|uniref:AAA family ATPase n=1 Tax=Lentisalinibacter orientalis TaxID=2992241 RepID=UPI00386E64F0
MRLRRLALENWKGIDACDVRFADGVTIVEGPNEAGKSTLVEALLTLVRELDSSKKQAIRAVMPVGRDVGSTVTAEIETGDYRFVYSKTYNKSPQTTLDVSAPRREQLAGREAHERVEAILNETVDLALWQALLTEQGDSLTPADLRNSEGLSNALDEAAGHATTGVEDMDLYDAARAEYERYYTPRTGKPRFAQLEQDHEAAVAARDAAAAALAEVERDAEAHDRLQADVRRRREALPDLEARVREHEASWQSVTRLRQELELAETRLASAADQQAAAARALEERKALADTIATDEKALAVEKEKQQPLAERARERAKRVDSARLVAEDKRKRRNAAREQVEAARRDLGYLEDRDRLAKNEQRLKDHAAVAEQLKQTSKTLNGIAIDDAGLEAIRDASHELDKAKSKRDLAATAVTVTAEQSVDFIIEDEDVSLVTGEAEKRTIASGLEIRFPGLASVRIAPPRTAAELESDLSEAESALASALERYRVHNLAEAIEQNEIRRSAEAERQRLRARAAEILSSGGAREKGEEKGEVKGEETAEEIAEEIAESVRSLRERCEAFLELRDGQDGLPADAAAAREALTAAEHALKDAESEYEAAQQRETELRAEHAEADAALREAKESLIGREATLKDRQQRLRAARAEAADDALEAKVRAAAAAVERLEADTAAIRRRLDQLDPDSVESLYTNARDALTRAERDLTQTEQQLAVLHDRLERARADGRYDALETADRRVTDTADELATTRRRAAAAERLWTTLNQHRDAARQAYVRPLKDAIERLGRIVFGQSFEVAIGDDWKLEAVTRDEQTLPFEALSVGAQEQLGILARLAAARIVAEQGGVPLIIDDALGFSDPTRLETMGAAIAAAGRDCQIIILTCTPGRFAHVGSGQVVAL